MFNLFQKKSQGEQITLKIKGMHCTSCAMNIDGALEDTDGVFSSETSYAQSKVNVSFDPKKIDQAKISQVIAQEGYEVE
jgi:copper chaperone CopZ